MNKIYYIVKDHFPSGIKYTPLKPTGRWKLSFVPYMTEPILFIEHKGIMFKKWVSEHDVKLRTEQKDYVYDCNSKFNKLDIVISKIKRMLKYGNEPITDWWDLVDGKKVKMPLKKKV